MLQQWNSNQIKNSRYTWSSDYSSKLCNKQESYENIKFHTQKHWYKLTAKRIHFVSPQADLFLHALFYCKGCKKLCDYAYQNVGNCILDWNSVQFVLCLPLSGYLFNRVPQKKLHYQISVSLLPQISQHLPLLDSRKISRNLQQINASNGQY